MLSCVGRSALDEANRPDALFKAEPVNPRSGANERIDVSLYCVVAQATLFASLSGMLRITGSAIRTNET